MNELLKFKAVEVLRNNHKLAQLYVSFRIKYKFSIYDRFEWSRRNEDLDFEEKNKWKFIKSQIVLLPAMKLWENFKSLIFFTSRQTGLLTHLPLFQH